MSGSAPASRYKTCTSKNYFGQTKKVEIFLALKLRNAFGQAQNGWILRVECTCNRWVGQDLCMPNVCPPFNVDKVQVQYTSFQGLTFTNLCTTSEELSVRVKMSFML